MEEAFVQVRALRKGFQVPAGLNFFKDESCCGSLTKQERLFPCLCFPFAAGLLVLILNLFYFLILSMKLCLLSNERHFHSAVQTLAVHVLYVFFRIYYV